MLWKLRLTVLLCCAALAARASAATATYDLAPPALVGNIASMDVSLMFDDQGAAGAGVVFFQIDVSNSDAALTGAGSDFSRFSFIPAAPLLDDWGLFADFGPSAFDSVVAYDLDTGLFPGSALGHGTHLLGALQVDLSGPGIGSSVTIAIDGIDTAAGFEYPAGNFGSFDFVDPIAYDNASRTVTTGVVVPLPAAVWAAMPLLIGVAAIRRLRKR